MITVGQAQQSRLIILLPEMLAGNMELARSIASAVKQKTHELIYLVAMEHPNSSLQVTRSMVTMKAMTVTRFLNVSFQLIPRSALMKTLKQYSSPEYSAYIPRPLPDHPGRYRFIPVRLSDRFWLRKIMIYSKNNIPAMISSNGNSLRDKADGLSDDGKTALEQEEDLL